MQKQRMQSQQSTQVVCSCCLHIILAINHVNKWNQSKQQPANCISTSKTRAQHINEMEASTEMNTLTSLHPNEAQTHINNNNLTTQPTPDMGLNTLRYFQL